MPRRKLLQGRLNKKQQKLLKVALFAISSLSLSYFVYFYGAKNVLSLFNFKVTSKLSFLRKKKQALEIVSGKERKFNGSKLQVAATILIILMGLLLAANQEDIPGDKTVPIPRFKVDGISDNDGVFAYFWPIWIGNMWVLRLTVFRRL